MTERLYFQNKSFLKGSIVVGASSLSPALLTRFDTIPLVLLARRLLQQFHAARSVKPSLESCRMSTPGMR